jgi:Heterokaryon incompatibility protein (HET)
MSQIYRQAPAVHVWLGEEKDNSARAMELIRQITYIPRDQEERETWYYKAKPGQTHRPGGPGKPMVKLPDQPKPLSTDEKAQNFPALLDFFRRPWFSRVWIRQEIALAQEVTIHCGSETCEWSQMILTASTLSFLIDDYHLNYLQWAGVRDKHSLTSVFQKAADLAIIRHRTGRDRKTPSYQPLKFLLLDSWYCGASDLRDKVYSMLSLSNPDKTDLIADYYKDCSEVYKAATIALLNMDIGYLAGCQNPSRSNGLPSWVPDLAEPAKFFPFASDGKRSRFVYVPDACRLDIEGQIFDEVKAVDNQSYISAMTSNREIEAVLVNWWELYKMHPPPRESKANRISSQKQWEKNLVHPPRERPRKEWLHFSVENDSSIDEEPWLKRVRHLLLPDTLSYAQELSRLNDFAEFRSKVIGRRMVMTALGFDLAAPPETRAGDRLCVFDGGNSTFIIRDAGENNDTWVLVGQACEPSLRTCETTLLT